MKKILLFILSFVLLCFTPTKDSFKDEQLKYQRVRTAYSEKEEYLKTLLTKVNINTFAIDIFIRAFKKEEKLEVWVKGKNNTNYVFLKTYDICSTSGELGPKRKRGDLQIPEGFYHINTFNPYSNFYLSLQINYPNRSDRILGYKANLGGDIFIHGNCVTIGCIPITDDKIKELYVLAVEAKSSGQSKIPVHIFPAKLDTSSFDILKTEFSGNDKLIDFWQNLKSGYNYFEKNKQLPDITVDNNGKYLFE